MLHSCECMQSNITESGFCCPEFGFIAIVTAAVFHRSIGLATTHPERASALSRFASFDANSTDVQPLHRLLLRHLAQTKTNTFAYRDKASCDDEIRAAKQVLISLL